jgi:hypothetical protein
MYVILAYSKKRNKRADVYIMQHEFVPVTASLGGDNSFPSNESGMFAIKKTVSDNYSYLERLEHRHRIIDRYPKPSINEDWNEYALQRLIANDLLKHESVAVVYDTEYKDIITMRF